MDKRSPHQEHLEVPNFADSFLNVNICHSSVTRILNFGPNTNTNIFVMENFNEYEYRIYSFLANWSNPNIEYIRS